MPAIEILNLKKNYGSTLALGGVDLAIREGEFFGLLGPNGAGKTTLISAIAGLVKPDQGTLRVMGHDLAADPLGAKRNFGLCPQEVNIHYYMPIRKIVEFHGGFYGLAPKQAKKRAEDLLKLFSLWDKRNDGRWKLSGGMQRRLMIVRALMGHPKILILDEPTAGIDVELRHDLWDLLKKLNAEGMTILLTTHYIEEAEVLCGRVGIIHEGKLIACDTPKKLIENHCLPEGRRLRGRLRFTRPGTLEEVFVSLTGKAIMEGEECVPSPSLPLS